MNIATWLHRAARSYPDQPAIGDGDQSVLSYRELGARCAALGGTLRSRYGLEPGDRVAIASQNDPAYLEALLGIWWAGGVPVPINAKLHPAEIGWIIENAEAALAFISQDLEGPLGALLIPSLCDLVALGSHRYESLTRGESIGLTARSRGDLAWLFYTSGTTGRPKGAMLTHGNLTTMSLAYLAEVDPTALGDRLLHAAPMSHGSGLYALPHVARAGLNIIPESRGVDASEVLDLIGHWGRTSMFAPPTIVKRMTECPTDLDPRRIRTIIWGGAPMYVSDTVKAIDRFGPRLAQIYGQGETPMTISVLSKQDIANRADPRWRERLGSVGRVSCAIDLRLAGSSQKADAADGRGEILVRGDTVMAGYWRNQEATDAALEDSWLHTGDIGVFDDQGFLSLLDRSKDLIISGGSNVYPREVEEVVAGHPRVQDVAVIGRPDPEWGEVVVAYVVGDLEAGELDRRCLGQIARFKRPRDYVFLPALPKNGYGKTMKGELRRLDVERRGSQTAFVGEA